MTAYLMPIVQPFVDNNGQPLAGGLVYTCIAGAASYTGSNLQTTWSDPAGTVANTNPIVLDSSGRCSMYGGTLPYKIYVFTSNNVPVGSPIDNVYPLSFSQSIYTGISNLAPNKNLIDNAAFNIWQRGPSVSVSAGTLSCTADRWSASPSTGTTSLTGTADTMIINGVSQPCLKVTNASAVSSLAAEQYVPPCSQVLEGYSVYPYLQAGGSFTVSLWFSASATGDYSVALQNADNSYSYVHTINVGSSNSPQQYSFVVYIPSSGVWNCNNNSSQGMRLLIGAITGPSFSSSVYDTWVRGSYIQGATSVNWCASSGSYIKIAQVRIEQGTSLGVWTPMKYDEDLRRCQYFLPCFSSGVLGTGSWNSATNGLLALVFPCSTRIAPTGVSISPGLTLYTAPFSLSSVSFNGSSTRQIGCLQLTGTDASVGGASLIYTTGPGNVIFKGAEL